MNSILTALGFFLLAILSHALAFRRGLIRFQLERFFLLSLFWALVFFLFVFFSPGPPAGAHSIGGVPLVFTSFILYALLCLAYLGECTTIQVQSPSMKIVSLVSRDGGRGMTLDQLKQHFTDEEFILSRLQDLVRAGYAGREGEVFFLTPRGRRIARIFKTYQRLIRRNMEA